MKNHGHNVDIYYYLIKNRDDFITMLWCTLIVSPALLRESFSPCQKKTEGDEEGEKNEV